MLSLSVRYQTKGKCAAPNRTMSSCQRHRARGHESFPLRWLTGRTAETPKKRLVRSTQSVRSSLVPQDIDTLVVDPLADVPGPMRDFEPPAKMHSKAIGELPAVLEMPKAARKSMRPLGHSVVHPRQVRGRRIVVSLAE